MWVVCNVNVIEFYRGMSLLINHLKYTEVWSLTCSLYDHFPANEMFSPNQLMFCLKIIVLVRSLKCRKRMTDILYKKESSFSSFFKQVFMTNDKAFHVSRHNK